MTQPSASRLLALPLVYSAAQRVIDVDSEHFAAQDAVRANLKLLARTVLLERLRAARDAEARVVGSEQGVPEFSDSTSLSSMVHISKRYLTELRAVLPDGVRQRPTGAVQSTGRGGPFVVIIASAVSLLKGLLPSLDNVFYLRRDRQRETNESAQKSLEAAFAARFEELELAIDAFSESATRLDSSDVVWASVIEPIQQLGLPFSPEASQMREVLRASVVAAEGKQHALDEARMTLHAQIVKSGQLSPEQASDSDEVKRLATAVVESARGREQGLSETALSRGADALDGEFGSGPESTRFGAGSFGVW